MIKTNLLILFLLIINIFSQNCYAKEYTAKDVLAFTRIAYVIASPDGQEVAFITWNRSNTNQYNWHYILNLKDNNGKIKQIAQSDYISSINWSPNGTSIAFITTNNNQQTISVYQLASQKVLAIVTLSRSINALKWSRSGRQIAFVADDEIKNQQLDNNLINVSGKTINSRLYLIPKITNHTSFKPITSSDYSISDSLFGGGFDWSFNDQEIAFNYQPSAQAIDGSKSKVAILNLVTLKYSIIPFCITHTCNTPMYSPNGNWLAFSSNIQAHGKSKALLEDIGTQNQICLMNQAKQTHCLQNTFNQNPYLFAWKFNSQAVYVGDMYKTEGPQLYELNQDPNLPNKRISTQTGFIEPLTLSINNTNTVFGFGYESVNLAPEAFTASESNFKLTQITNINKKFNQLLGDIKTLKWQSTDGTSIEGLLITPANYDSKHKYPLYVDVHGGPSSAQVKRYLGGCDEYSERFAPTTCSANILSLGYIILQVNYRGSNGYGLNFRVKNFADFGGGDYKDIISGIDNLVKKGLVEPNKIAIAGWSYGGYLTTWAISHSNRFNVAIDGDGLTNLISYTGTSNDTDFCSRYLGTYYWEGNQSLYWERSPIAYAQKIKTPLLILQCAKDNRVPQSQAQELYTALNTLNKPVKMLIASRQSHEPIDPDTISKEIEAIDKWLQNHILGSSS